MHEHLLRILRGVQEATPKDGSLWMPPPVSTVAGHVDWLFYFILGVSTFFFLLIVALMVLFVVRYRRREGQGAEVSPSHNTALEVIWTVIPIVVVIVIFIFGFKGFLDMATPPANAYEIQVEAQKWSWSFTYPSGYVDSNLHVPVNRPVKLVMRSADVIHSLYVPAFRIKRDVVPGRYATAWFEATEPGEYDLFCAEYCGTSHSDMLAHVVVHPPGEFETVAGQGVRLPRHHDAGRGGAQAVPGARVPAVPQRRRDRAHRAHDARRFRARAAAGLRRAGGRRRELPAAVRPRARGPGGGRLRPGHADLPGTPERPRNRRPDRVPEVLGGAVSHGCRQPGHPHLGSGSTRCRREELPRPPAGAPLLALHPRPQADRGDVPGRHPGLVPPRRRVRPAGPDRAPDARARRSWTRTPTTRCSPCTAR